MALRQPDKTSRRRRFVVCIQNEGYVASLEMRKIYEVLPDAAAGKHPLLRIVDESGEDYLYPAAYFSADYAAAEDSSRSHNSLMLRAGLQWVRRPRLTATPR